MELLLRTKKTPPNTFHSAGSLTPLPTVQCEPEGHFSPTLPPAALWQLPARTFPCRAGPAPARGGRFSTTDRARGGDRPLPPGSGPASPGASRRGPLMRCLTPDGGSQGGAGSGTRTPIGCTVRIRTTLNHTSAAQSGQLGYAGLSTPPHRSRPTAKS